MEIGFVGLGKLGLPSALAIESKGHNVIGYDISDDVRRIIANKKLPYKEAGAQELLSKSNIRFKPLADVLKESEIIFVPVQTPHDVKYEGITKLLDTTKDFDYRYLKQACKSISDELDKLGEDRIIVIISTAIPGAIEREIKPVLGKHVKLCYNPFFIAMGTTVDDFLNPEIILLGVDNNPDVPISDAIDTVEKVKEFYRTITDAPFHEMSIINAELVKVNYNTFITMKINFANNLMEVCHNLRDEGANVDTVIDALSDCNKRIISSTYMRGGMPDSGGCHPRDNIALADFAKKHNLSNDIYTEAMKTRERHIGWFKGLIDSYSRIHGLPKVIMGKAYKPESNLIVGSSSIRLFNEYKDAGDVIQIWDPNVDDSTDSKLLGERLRTTSHIFFIGTQHKEFAEFKYPKGSVVIDPFRYIPKSDDIEVIGLGK